MSILKIENNLKDNLKIGPLENLVSGIFVIIYLAYILSVKLDIIMQV